MHRFVDFGRREPRRFRREFVCERLLFLLEFAFKSSDYIPVLFYSVQFRELPKFAEVCLVVRIHDHRINLFRILRLVLWGGKIYRLSALKLVTDIFWR